jgi:hypothetical protein
MTLHSSTNFAVWEPIGTFHDVVHPYPDLRTNVPARFYRAHVMPRASSNDWKNQIVYPEEPFRQPSSGPNDVEWVKFSIIVSEPTRVFYQDSAAFPFHYEFATQRLAPFQGMTRAAFDSISLFRTNQQVVLGAVLLSPPEDVVEYGIQFIGLEAYPPEEIARWYELVKATVYTASGAGVYYMPTFEQSEVARTNRAAFEALGVPISSIERWIAGNHCYAGGWALGTLKYFPATEITAAYADGRLKPADILLTDGVPAETPLVAGIITLRASTPNSHTAILARAFGIPYVYFADPHAQTLVQGLSGRKIVLRAIVSAGEDTKLEVFDVEGALTEEQQTQLLTLKKVPPMAYTPKQTLGAYQLSTDNLTPADIRFFGGKAANYGFLRRSVPTNSPPAIAFSFDLWDEFMTQILPGKPRTLRQEIDSRLAPFTNYPPDMMALKTALAEVRSLIRQSASFTGPQRTVITNALAVFDPYRKIRFRSSTNVEDSENFTGAGLYDSYSGCLLDELDSDDAGPSQCDPTEPSERGVFRAIQRVYASFYNDNAFLARLQHGANEAEVGMGVLVHHSFPDEDELANGVATITHRYYSGWTSLEGDLVTQKGAESVTNPEGRSLPEVVAFSAFNNSRFFTLTRYSSLVPLGAHVMDWESDYRGVADLFGRIAESFHAYYPKKTVATLDFEYKKDRFQGLVVKQVREIPQITGDGTTLGFLINQPMELVVFQGESGDVFSNHRVKSVWNLETRNMWLASTNLAQGIYTTGRTEYIEGADSASLSGDLATWPMASHSDDGVTNAWMTGPTNNTRKWQLTTTVQTHSTQGEPPVFYQGDFARRVNVAYAKPLPTIHPFWGLTNTSFETALLEPRRALTAGSKRIERSYTTNGVAITTSFYWPKPDTGIVAGYTAPLVRFDQTVVTGLTTAPICLTNYYSQTYRPGHHNFTEEFIFEPRLDPSLSAATRAELEAANIHLIYLELGSGDNAMVLGLDGKFRPL